MKNDTETTIRTDWHFELACQAFLNRGYRIEEVRDMARLCEDAAVHGIHSHNLIKAIHLDDLFGSKVGGTRPGAEIVVSPSRFGASENWNAQSKLGPTVGWRAMQRSIELAEKNGIGMVSVNNAWHYLWGGAYVLEAAKRGFIAYTNCTSMLAEVAPYGGKYPTLGTNPHSWAFPTQDILGYPILVDWATSSAAMGRIQQYKREGATLAEGMALDAEGNPTTDPGNVFALLPFGRHKGFGLGLINELMAGWIGGGIPTLRGRFDNFSAETQSQQSCTFYFQAIHPEALGGTEIGSKIEADQNLKKILEDIRSHGNQDVLFPGELEHRHAERSKKAGGLLFSASEVRALEEIAGNCGIDFSEALLD